MKNKYITLLMICLVSFAYSQERTDLSSFKDSNEKRWKERYDITIKAIDQKSDSTTYYIEEVQELTEKLSDCSRCQVGMAFLLFYQKEADKDEVRAIIELGEQALELAQQYKTRDFEIKILNDLGFFYREIGATAKATTYLFKSLEYSREMGYRAQEGDALRHLSNLFLFQQDYEKGLEYALQAQKTYKAIGDIRRERAILFELHDLYEGMGEQEKALEYLFENFEPKYASIMSLLDSARVYNNIGRVYQRNNQPQKAISYLEESLKMRDKATGRLYTLNELMTVYKGIEDYPKALKYINIIEPQLDSTQDIYLKRNIQMHFSDIFAATGNYEKAYAAEYAFGEYRDSINRITEKGIVLGLEAKYENQIKEDQIALLNKDKAIAMDSAIY